MWSLVLGRGSIATSAEVTPNGGVARGMPPKCKFRNYSHLPRYLQMQLCVFPSFWKTLPSCIVFFQLFSAGKMSSPQVMAIHKKCGSVLGGIHLEAVLGTLNDMRDLWKWEASSKQLSQTCVLEFMSPYSYRHPVTPPEVRYGWPLTKTNQKHWTSEGIWMSR